MMFWLTIVLSLIFAYLGMRKGFYETLVFAFNLGLSVYLGLFLTPYLVTTIPATLDIPGGLPLTLFLLCLAFFLILFSASFLLFTGQFTVSFPKICDVLGASFIGFLSGFFLVSFLSVILSMAPVPQIHDIMKDIDLSSNQGMLRGVCDRIHAFVGQSNDVSTDTVLQWLQEKADTISRQASSPEVPDPNVDFNDVNSLSPH
jgi:hypothetical protein